MSVGKKIRYSLLGLTLGVIMCVCITTLIGLFNVKGEFASRNKEAINKLYSENVSEITNSSTELAQSLSKYYAQTINVDFERIQGELKTICGDIFTVSKNGGTVKENEISRCEEYIVSEAASISDDEINETVKKYGALTSMFDNVLKHEPNISLAYFVFDNGVVISSTDTFYPEVEKTDMREREWYKETVTGDGGIHWSELYVGKTDNRQYITCSMKVCDNNNDIVGVVAFDLRVSEISEKTLVNNNASFVSAFILDRKGEVLLSSIGIEETSKERYFEGFINSIDLENDTEGTYDKDENIIGFAQIDSTKWILVTILDYDKMMQPVNTVSSSISDTGKKLSSVINENIRNLLLVFVLILLIVIYISLVVSRKLSKLLTKSVDILVEGVKVVGQGDLDYEINLETNDEMGLLAQSFNQMTIKLKKYVEEVAKDASEKQRLASELDVARNIQLGMLPEKLNCTDYDIEGMMIPAKEVGGDFYDFFELPEDRICFLVADVSGKGVGAALFMTISKTVIKTAATSNTSIDELLEVANNLLCEQNPACLFVTVFIGILDKKTGDIRYSCAAHNPPVILQKNGEVRFIEVKHRLPLAAMEGMSYPVMEVNIKKGDSFILYTDGVTEATDDNTELFGDDRLLEAIRNCKDMNSKKIIENIKKEVDCFVGDAPQFDDITITVITR